jgi:excisionase family DNA binding protein
MKIELHSAEEVASTLGVELDTLYRYARKGRIHGMKVGKAWKFLDGDVQEFLEQHRYAVKPAEGKTSLLPENLRRSLAQNCPPGATTSADVESSYPVVDAASNLLAESLLRNGVASSGRVLVLLTNSLEFMVACFAVWKAGAILVPEDPAIGDESLRQMLQTCAPQALIVDRGVADRLAGMRQACAGLRVIYVKSRSPALASLNPIRIEFLDAMLDSKRRPKAAALPCAASESAGTQTGNFKAPGKAGTTSQNHQK